MLISDLLFMFTAVLVYLIFGYDALLTNYNKRVVQMRKDIYRRMRYEPSVWSEYVTK